jgi:hypothetical protein
MSKRSHIDRGFAETLREIAEIDDPELRARTLRESGLLGLDVSGHPGGRFITVAGPETALNAAVVGNGTLDAQPYHSWSPRRRSRRA